jgi:hypothetical protein
MKRHIPAIAALVVLMAPATAQAAFLHVGEAQLQTKKLAKSFAPKLKATSFVISGCTHRDGHRIQCKVVFKVPGDINEACEYRSLVNKSDNGIWTRLLPVQCVEG